MSRRGVTASPEAEMWTSRLADILGMPLAPPERKLEKKTVYVGAPSELCGTNHAPMYLADTDSVVCAACGVDLRAQNVLDL